MERRIFTTTTRVLYGDTDAAGVVYNANYLRYFEYARTEMMRNWVCSYKEIEDLGFVLPVTESWIRYKAPAFYDDLLTLECYIAELSRLKCTFKYRVLRKSPEQDKEKLLVKGYTVHVATTRKGKLIRFPDELLAKITEACNLDNIDSE